jgi:hypothetical protein
MKFTLLSNIKLQFTTGLIPLPVWDITEERYRSTTKM